MQLETSRTIMRELLLEDALSFFALNEDADVLKYTGDQPFESVQEAENFLENYDQYKKYGVGRLAVIEKQTNNFLGWCGLKYSPEQDEYDLGFRFSKNYWNKGYATETAQKCIDYAFHQLGIQRIIGRAMLENKASIRVLEKLGMKFLKTFDFEGHEGVIYELHASDDANSKLNT